MKLSKMINLGEVIEKQLCAVGITDSEELIKAGAKQAFIRLNEYDDTSCMHKLLALEGAVEGVKKSQLSEQTNQDLKEFFKAVKSGE